MVLYSITCYCHMIINKSIPPISVHMLYQHAQPALALISVIIDFLTCSMHDSWCHECVMNGLLYEQRRKPSTISVRPDFLKCVQICVFDGNRNLNTLEKIQTDRNYCWFHLLTKLILNFQRSHEQCILLLFSPQPLQMLLVYK